MNCSRQLRRQDIDSNNALTLNFICCLGSLALLACISLFDTLTMYLLSLGGMGLSVGLYLIIDIKIRHKYNLGAL